MCLPLSALSLPALYCLVDRCLAGDVGKICPHKSLALLLPCRWCFLQQLYMAATWHTLQYLQEVWGQSNTQSTCTSHWRSQSPFPTPRSDRKRLKDKSKPLSNIWFLNTLHHKHFLMSHRLWILTLFWISSRKLRESTYSVVTVGTKSSLNWASWASAIMSSIFFFASWGRMSLMA